MKLLNSKIKYYQQQSKSPGNNKEIRFVYRMVARVLKEIRKEMRLNEYK